MPQFEDLHLGVFCCGHVLRQERPILLVAHETDGDWQFRCGGADHNEDDLYHVHLHHILDADPRLHDLADLHLGWEAERPDIGATWSITQSVARDE
jgi:hypothetical protein